MDLFMTLEYVNSRMADLTRRQWIASVGAALGGATLGAGCQMLEDDSSPPPSGTSGGISQEGTDRSGSGLLAPLTSETQNASPDSLYNANFTVTTRSTQTEIHVGPSTQRRPQPPTTHAVSVQFEPLKTFTNDEYGYQIDRPIPWKITNSEADGDEQGKRVAWSDPLEVVSLSVDLSDSSNGGSLTDQLRTYRFPWYTFHQKKRTTHDGQDALRYDWSYVPADSDPRLYYRAQGLITRLGGNVLSAECRALVYKRFHHQTPTSPPPIVEWTPDVGRGSSRILNSLTLP